VGPLAATVEGCDELLEALVPGFERASLASLEELTVGVAWLEEAEPLVRSRVEAAAAQFPHRRNVELPIPERAEYPAFMREAADVHRGLFPERADDYGESVRWKLERCLAVTDGEVATAKRLRAAYRERCAELCEAIDLLLTPTVPLVAPPDDADERELRGRVTRLTYPFNVLGWPALALPCGPAEDGLPASVQLVGRPGDDARVLAAGRLLASPI
jgi:Asp-tRNA(Asn)/Glu-tRNA(Gln) amidotransferase A subunit family amidase